MNALLIPILVGILAQVILAWTLTETRRDFRGLAAAFLLADILAVILAASAWILLAGFGIWN